MKKKRQIVAIIILILVLGFTMFGCIQTQATKVDYKTHAFFVGKYKKHYILDIDICEDKANGRAFLSQRYVYDLTKDKAYFDRGNYVEFEVDNTVIEDVLAFVECFGEEIKITKNELIVDNGTKYQLEKGVYNDVMYHYDQLEMYFLDDDGIQQPYVLIGRYSDEHESPSNIYIKGRKYLTGGDGNLYMYNITIVYDYVKHVVGTKIDGTTITNT